MTIRVGSAPDSWGVWFASDPRQPTSHPAPLSPAFQGAFSFYRRFGVPPIRFMRLKQESILW